MRHVLVHDPAEQQRRKDAGKIEAGGDDAEGAAGSTRRRRLAHQHVARGLIPNNERSYKNLGSLINDARLAGLIDWEHLEDRTRNLRALPHWSDPESIIHSAAASYRIDKWAEQPAYVEVWIEKDALVGVIEGVCSRYDVPYFSCRGYTSQSELWNAAMRLVPKLAEQDKEGRIIHLGDHDPSGIDMTRDIADRLFLFLDLHVRRSVIEERMRVHRIALTIDQVRTHNPPPNPAKLTDSRASGYLAEYGDEAWELDALDPTTIDGLVERTISAEIDQAQWDADLQREDDERLGIERVAHQWEAIASYLAEQAS